MYLVVPRAMTFAFLLNINLNKCEICQHFKQYEEFNCMEKEYVKHQIDPLTTLFFLPKQFGLNLMLTVHSGHQRIQSHLKVKLFA